MARVSYNGFSAAHRSKVGRWYRAVGHRRLKPVARECEGCGSTENVAGHNEDYHNPKWFWSVCKRCHVWIHRRIRNPEGFERYREQLPTWSRLWLLDIGEVDLSDPDPNHPYRAVLREANRMTA